MSKSYLYISRDLSEELHNVAMALALAWGHNFCATRLQTMRYGQLKMNSAAQLTVLYVLRGCRGH